MFQSFRSESCESQISGNEGSCRFLCLQLQTVTNKADLFQPLFLLVHPLVSGKTVDLLLMSASGAACHLFSHLKSLF